MKQATIETTGGGEQRGTAGGAGVPMLVVYPVFVASGFSSLLYQLIWQRALLTIYGTNIESVTVVVSAFMIGLGLGGLAGGAVSRNPRRPLLLIFALVEIGTGVYGAVSLQLFAWVGTYTAGNATLETGIFSFLLVLLPTLLMGSTLPLLVAYQVNRVGDVGYSVGMLYFVNTLGAAMGAFAAALLFFKILGLSGALGLAVSLNIVVGIVVFLAYLRDGGGR